MNTLFTFMRTLLLGRMFFRNLFRLLPTLILIALLIITLTLSAQAAVITPTPLNDDSGGMWDFIVNGIVGGLLGGLGNVLEFLFVPSPDFFDGFRTDIQNAINDRFCCAIIYFNDITDRFSQLQAAQPTNNALMLNIPANHLFEGQQAVSQNLLGGLDDFATWFRGLSSALIVVVTVIICYRKAIEMLRT